MVNFLSMPLLSRRIFRCTGAAPAFLARDRKDGARATTDKVQNGNRSDQGEGQCATVVQIIERVCASQQKQLGCYTFLAWGDFRRRL